MIFPCVNSQYNSYLYNYNLYFITLQKLIASYEKKINEIELPTINFKPSLNIQPIPNYDILLIPTFQTGDAFISNYLNIDFDYNFEKIIDELGNNFYGIDYFKGFLFCKKRLNILGLELLTIQKNMYVYKIKKSTYSNNHKEKIFSLKLVENKIEYNIVFYERNISYIFNH